MYIQIILLLIAVFMLGKAWDKFKRKQISQFSFGVWIIFYLIFVVVVAYPHSTTYIAHIVGIGRGADLVMYAAFILIFYTLFNIFIRLKELDKNITIITRHLSLKDAEKHFDNHDQK